VVSPEGIGFGKALRWAQGNLGAPLLTHNGLQESGAPALTVPASHVLTSANNTAASQANVILELDWGRWNETDVIASTNRLDRSIVASNNSSINWALFKPASVTLADLKGKSYTLSDYQLSNDAGHTEFHSVNMNFDIDMGTGNITNGQIGIMERIYIDTAPFEGDYWDAGFSGSIQSNGFTQLTGSGSFYERDFANNLPEVGAPATLSIQGVFVGTGSTPAFLSGFVLQQTGVTGNFVQGLLLNEHLLSE